MLGIGFGNYVSPGHIISILSIDSAPVKRLVSEGRERGAVIDASFGRSTKAVIVTGNGNLILSSLTPEVLSARLEEEDRESD